MGTTRTSSENTSNTGPVVGGKPINYGPARACHAVCATNQSLTAFGTSTVVDGYTTGVSKRVLLAGQSTASENGPYVIQTDGSLLRDLYWSREFPIAQGTTIVVLNGDTYEGTVWVATSSNTGLSPTITPDIDSVTFTQIGYLRPAVPAASGNIPTLAADGTLQDSLRQFTTDTTLHGASAANTRVPTELAVKTYVDSILGSNDAMVYKGVLDCSSNPNYPAADAGHTYRVSVAGKVGGASGTNVEVGDLLLCNTDGTAAGTQAAVGAYWNIVQVNIDGAVTGPSSSVSGNVPTFSGTSGKVVQDSLRAFSTDGTFASNTNLKVPTEAAVKTYVDTGDNLKLAKASDLSDLANAATARTNLGLGSLATLSAIDGGGTTATTVVQVRRATRKAWFDANPTPAAGEICFESDTGMHKIGDGTNGWRALRHTIGQFTHGLAAQGGGGSGIVQFNGGSSVVGASAAGLSTNIRIRGTQRYTSSGAAGATAGAALLGGHRVTDGYAFFARNYFNDASYNNTGAGTGSRIFCGMTDQSATNMTNTDTPGGAGVLGFFRRHVNGGATDTNWQFIGKSTGVYQDTGVAFAVGKIYEFWIVVTPGGSTADWMIINVTDGTYTSGTYSSTMPTAGMFSSAYGALVGSVDAVARSVDFSACYVRDLTYTL